MPHMYILRCWDGSYYVGSTWNLERRLEEHASGLGAKYTSRLLPVALVYCEEYAAMYEAYAREKQVQGWSRRKRESLINGEFGALPGLSRRGPGSEPSE